MARSLCRCQVCACVCVDAPEEQNSSPVSRSLRRYGGGRLFRLGQSRPQMTDCSKEGKVLSPFSGAYRMPIPHSAVRPRLVRELPARLLFHARQCHCRSNLTSNGYQQSECCDHHQITIRIAFAAQCCVCQSAHACRCIVLTGTVSFGVFICSPCIPRPCVSGRLPNTVTVSLDDSTRRDILYSMVAQAQPKSLTARSNAYQRRPREPGPDYMPGKRPITPCECVLAGSDSSLSGEQGRHALCIKP
ncbi:hypothetical protein C8Q80DRAFT_154301 [Daedaleopsis nitida]|nr:hypothetical protein C8Q80DRAFT_154301 [Daedaleopsis nitida]